MVQAADGSMGAQLFRVAGIFRSGSPDLDRGVVYLLRKDAQSLFSLGNGVSEAALLLDSSQSVDEARRFLAGRLAGAPVEVLPWYVVEPFLQQFIDLDDAFFYIIVLILFIVISVGILNTVMMSVFERVREFGVMMALGMRPRQVVRLVMQESAVLALLGAVVGACLGSASTILFAYIGIDLSSYSAGASALGHHHHGDPSSVNSAESDLVGSLRRSGGPAGGAVSGHQGGGVAPCRSDPARLRSYGPDRTRRRLENLSESRRGTRTD